MKVGTNTNLAFFFKYHSFLFLTERVFKKFNWNVTYVSNLNHNLITYANNLYNTAELHTRDNSEYHPVFI